MRTGMYAHVGMLCLGVHVEVGMEDSLGEPVLTFYLAWHGVFGHFCHLASYPMLTDS